jgi:hypothetical protein
MFRSLIVGAKLNVPHTQGAGDVARRARALGQMEAFRGPWRLSDPIEAIVWR